MKKLLLGNEAVARGAYEAGATVATAYPGTPSTEITEALSKYDGIYCEWSPNEKVALEVALGASIAGARSICSMKHVGLNVASDPLFTASYTGINAGLVIVVADDPGMHSSQNEQDSRHYARAAKIPMLEPSDSSECREYVLRAFELSEEFDCPVILRLSTRVAHSRSIVETGERKEGIIKEYSKNTQKYVMMPAMARKRHLFVEERMRLLKAYAEKADLNRIEYGSETTGIITSGISYQYSKTAMENASFLKLGLVYPLPDEMIRQFSQKVQNLYVVEELDPFIEDQVRQTGIAAKGKDVFPITGELSPSLIKNAIFGAADTCESGSEPVASASAPVPIPARPPVMCPGCPHRGVFHVLNKLKLTVSGDIGCYTLGALPPLNAMDTCICMGASIGVAHGMEKAKGTGMSKKTVAVIGDSTFIHSGITGLIDIIYNNGHSTVIILDNSITGMTGHQHHPASGYNIKGEPANKIDIEKLVKCLGVDRVRVADPFDSKRFESILKEELAADAPSVIISRRPCALLKSTVSKGHMRVLPEKCKNCRLCMKFGCPAIMDNDGVISINDALCAGCTLCMNTCASEAIIIDDGAE